jgi:transcription antitermination factor NusG
MSWFVLRTRFGRERGIALDVRDLGPPFRSFCPLYRAKQFRSGRWITRSLPLWATYCLVDWQPPDDGDAWHRVLGMDGVLGVLGGAKPTPVPEEEVAGWVAEADERGVVSSLDHLLEKFRRGFVRGDKVRIEGLSSNGPVGYPFDGIEGICEWYDEKGVSVKTSLLGREVSLYVANGTARVLLGGTAVSAPVGKLANQKRTHRGVKSRRGRFPATRVASISVD